MVIAGFILWHPGAPMHRMGHLLEESHGWTAADGADYRRD